MCLSQLSVCVTPTLPAHGQLWKLWSWNQSSPPPFKKPKQSTPTFQTATPNSSMPSVSHPDQESSDVPWPQWDKEAPVQLSAVHVLVTNKDPLHFRQRIPASSNALVGSKARKVASFLLLGV